MNDEVAMRVLDRAAYLLEQPQTLVHRQALRHAVARNDARDIRAMLETHAQRLVLNTARSALQVLDCDGDYVAHLPLARSMVGELSSAAP
jgi:Tfp pilus assembly ATPase PilU